MKTFSNASSRSRQQITREAARLMAEEGVIDHQSAKAKAIERLGLPEKSARPDNREIENALVEYLELFEASELPQRRKRLRETAIEAMRLLRDFNSYLIGPVLSGTVTRYSRVQILAVAAPELISILLQDNEIPYDQDQRRLRRSTKDYITIQSFRFAVDEIDIEILCIESEAVSRTLLNPIDGKPFRRATLNEVLRLVEDTAKAV